MAGGKSAQLWTVNVVSFVLLTLLGITGLINWLVLPHGQGRHDGVLPGLRHFLMEVHVWAAVLFVVAMAFHLVLHWSYIKTNLKRLGWIKA